AFGYEYTTGSGDEATTHRFAVVQFVSAASLPDLEVYRGWRLRLSRHVRFADERFARAFDVRSPDRDFAHRVVHPGFIAALLDGALGECHLVLERGVFTVWRPGSLRVARVDDMLERLITVLELIPARVWADGRVEPPPIVPRPASAGEPGA
ncbi:MAG: hypothetical protein GXX86_13235, partial [Propionibacterium sp.]|nr:hypothetical protein [Propionibacterium sp.]